MNTKELIQLYVTAIDIDDFHSRIKFVLKTANVSQLMSVKFAIYCANDSLQYIDKKKDKKTYDACVDVITLTDMWTLDQGSVTTKQLIDAAYAAASAAYVTEAAVNAAFAAALATANVAYAANAAACAAKVAADAMPKQREYIMYLFELLGLDNKLFNLVG